MGFRYEMRVHSVFVPNTLNTTHDPPTLSLQQVLQASTYTNAPPSGTFEATLFSDPGLSSVIQCTENMVVHFRVTSGSVSVIGTNATIVAASNIVGRSVKFTTHCVQGSGIVITATPPCGFVWEGPGEVPPNDSGALSIGAIVGIVAGGVAVLAAAVLCFFCVCRRDKNVEGSEATPFLDVQNTDT